uniref:Uncharacterized protein n=1 Tax=Glossina pallidipes TaxID=7398 RepID=A0A1A9ZNK9_GLOPL
MSLHLVVNRFPATKFFYEILCNNKNRRKNYTITILLELKEEHKKQLNNLATQYSERMLIEYQKFSKLRESMLELRESYEAKLKKSVGTLQDTVEGLELDYKKQWVKEKD